MASWLRKRFLNLAAALPPVLRPRNRALEMGPIVGADLTITL